MYKLQPFVFCYRIAFRFIVCMCSVYHSPPLSYVILFPIYYDILKISYFQFFPSWHLCYFWHILCFYICCKPNTTWLLLFSQLSFKAAHMRRKHNLSCSYHFQCLHSILLIHISICIIYCPLLEELSFKFLCGGSARDKFFCLLYLYFIFHTSPLFLKNIFAGYRIQGCQLSFFDLWVYTFHHIWKFFCCYFFPYYFSLLSFCYSISTYIRICSSWSCPTTYWFLCCCCFCTSWVSYLCFI